MRWCTALMAIACVGTSQSVLAQSWTADGGKIRISGKYRDNNEVRVETFGVERRDTRHQFRVALFAVATLTRDKGFPRFAITKITECGMINGYGVTPCRLVARMLKAGENVPLVSGKTVAHFDTVRLLGALEAAPDAAAIPVKP